MGAWTLRQLRQPLPQQPPLSRVTRWLVTLSLFFAGACDSECSDGYTKQGEFCVASTAVDGGTGSGSTGCESNNECTSASASRCDSGDCVACTKDSECDHIDGKGVCDDGTCVECTGEEYAACTPNVCDSLKKVCTNRPEETKEACGGCVSDAECTDGMLCVMETFPDMSSMDQDLGYVCLWRKDASGTGAPNNSCLLNGRPYSDTVSKTSIDGEQAEVCALRVSTCSAHAMFSDTAQPCSGEDAHDECGEPNLSDAFCLDANPPTETFLCTVPCLDIVDCPSNVMNCFDPSVTSISGKVCEL